MPGQPTTRQLDFQLHEIHYGTPPGVLSAENLAAARVQFCAIGKFVAA